MAERIFGGIDLGAESGRVMAGLFDGRKIRFEELHRFSNGPVTLGDTMRWDLVGLWKEIQDGLSRLNDQHGKNLASIGVDTWGVDYVLMDDQQELLGVPYHYRDSRNNGMMEHAFTRVPRSRIFAATGLQFMQINSLYQILAMKQSNPALLDRADRFLMIADFFHWCLSGSQAVEFTNATTSQCYHASEGDWAYELLRQFEIPTDMFGEVVAPGTKLGSLRKEVAAATGLPKVDVVTPATHDTGSAVAAVPTDRTGKANWAYISSGTWSLMGVEIQDAIVTPRALEMNVTNEGGIDGTYRLLKNIMGLWLVQRIRLAFERQGQSLGYDELTQLASESKPFAALVDPDDPRFMNPEDMVQAINSYHEETGQRALSDPGPVVRCALESLALKYRHVLRMLEELTGEKVEAIHVVGGGSQSQLLNQFTANACGVPVIAGPVEATVIGNFMVQARTAGEVDSLAEIRDVVRRSFEMQTFEPKNTTEWDDANQTFRKLLNRPG